MAIILVFDDVASAAGGKPPTPGCEQVGVFPTRRTVGAGSCRSARSAGEQGAGAGSCCASPRGKALAAQSGCCGREGDGAAAPRLRNGICGAPVSITVITLY